MWRMRCVRDGSAATSSLYATSTFAIAVTCSTPAAIAVSAASLAIKPSMGGAYIDRNPTTANIS